MKSAKGKVIDLQFYGVCGLDFRAKEVVSVLMQNQDATEINLSINSPGGAVFEGLAIFNQLRTHPARVTAHIDGIAASITTVITCAADVVKMPENAFFMIHDPTALTWGGAEDHRRGADVLDRAKTAVINCYRLKSGLPATKISALMQSETWLNAHEAAALGFVDEVTQEIQLAACARLVAKHGDKFTRAPIVQQQNSRAGHRGAQASVMHGSLSSRHQSMTERAAAAWRRDPELRAEFREERVFLAYVAAVERGLVRDKRIENV